MNTAYYYEIHRQIQEDLKENLENSGDENFENQRNNDLHNTTNTITPTTTAIVSENLLNDYEIINNDEFEDDCEEIVDLTTKNNESKFKNSSAFYSISGNSNFSKLQVNLSPEQISLKAQATKDNNLITPETKVFPKSSSNEQNHQHHHQQKSNKRPQHVPLAFSIAPLSHVQQEFDEANNASSSDNTESNNLPEIVLTSFEMTTRRSMKKSSTVTFQTITTTTTTTPTTSQMSNGIRDQNCIEQLPRLFEKVPTLPSPAEVNLRQQQSHQTHNSNSAKLLNKNPNTTTAVVTAEVYDRFRHDSEDSSEINSQHGGGGNSTSPESLIDNILSAASSVSVCGSSTNSLSSAATDVTRLGVRIGVDNVKNRNVKVLDIPYSINNGEGAIINNASTAIESIPLGQRNVLPNSSLNSKTKSNEVFQPLLLLSPAPVSTTTAATNLTTPILSTRLNESQSWLQPPELFETASTAVSRSPSPAPSIRILPERGLYPDELKCQICMNLFQDPRTLSCLHSFCFQCLVNENFKEDKSIPFWSQPSETLVVPTTLSEDNEWKCSVKSTSSFRSLSPETTVRSASETASSPLRQRRSSFSFRRKKSQDRILLKAPKAKSDGRTSENASTIRLSILPSEMDKEFEKESEHIRFIVCKICNFATELPIGGLRQLPQNFMLVRKIEEIKIKAGDEVISRIFCSLCFEETNATYHCISCTLNLCSLCKDAHERQKTTANHKIKNIMELRRARKKQQNMLDDNTKFMLKCGMHPGFEIKSFCVVCLQVACSDCLVLLHKGHKHESISKASTNFSKTLNSAVDQTRPLCNYAENTIDRLNIIAKEINRKCDEVQSAVESFMQQYSEALEVHRKTLLQQVNRARESKIEMILEQQLDLEKRTRETMDVIRYCQELRENASDVEMLSFVSILLKRFEYCQQFKAPIDPKISDALHFLPKIVAPSTKEQNDITLYGIITMQTVEPAHCTLQMEGFSQLRLHKRVELTVLTRDADGAQLCHGGMLKQFKALLKYKESHSKPLPIELSDNRDGTYCIAFTPDAQGTLILTIHINEKPIKGSPFTFLARAVRPHSGIYHCCSFCSSGKAKGSKSVKCSCEGRMPGYNGCGHGHAGHPGRRHWSCCGNVLENSECNVENKLLNP